jgi:hypothetical protein
MILSEDKFPKTWEELKSMTDFIKSNSFENLRLPEVESFYDSYRNRVDRKTQIDILLDTFLEKDRILSKASFPYNNLTRNLPFVYHYCLWDRHGKVPDVEIDAEIKSNLKYEDYFWFENDLIAKSIPEIWHCHIFIKMK